MPVRSLQVPPGSVTSSGDCKEELEGYWSLRLGRIRIVYRLGEGAVEIVAIGPRESIYEEAARQIRRNQEKS